MFIVISSEGHVVVEFKLGVVDGLEAIADIDGQIGRDIEGDTAADLKGKSPVEIIDDVEVVPL